MGSYSEDGRGGAWGVTAYLTLALAAGTCGPGAVLAWRVSEDRALLAVVVGAASGALVLVAAAVAAFAAWSMLDARTEHRGARVERARTADLYTRAADRGGRGVVTIEAPRRYLGGPAWPDAQAGPPGGGAAEAPEDDLGDVLTWAPPPAAGAVSLAPPPPARRNGAGGAS